MTPTASAPSVAVQVRNLHASLSGVDVLQGIDLSITAGRWTSVVGPNGAGKSTLLKVLAGLLPHQGDVQLFGQSMASMPARERARRLAWLGQGEAAADDLTVYDVAMLGRLPHQGWLTSASDRDWQVVEGALRETQAWDWRTRALGQLSGGERQRVLLARALAVEAEVLLMDEPLANLDPPHQADWLATVRRLTSAGTTVVSVLHEVTMALHADALVIMAQGRMVHQGVTGDAVTHRAVEHVFDGRLAIHPVAGGWVGVPR
jgi:iron complex transport system ATP-binding protein